MTAAVRTAAMAPHQRRQQPPVWVIDRHPLGYGHEEHLGTAHWKRPWSAFTAAVALGLVGVIERVRETRRSRARCTPTRTRTPEPRSASG